MVFNSKYLFSRLLNTPSILHLMRFWDSTHSLLSVMRHSPQSLRGYPLSLRGYPLSEANCNIAARAVSKAQEMGCVGIYIIYPVTHPDFMRRLRHLILLRETND